MRRALFLLLGVGTLFYLLGGMQTAASPREPSRQSVNCSDCHSCERPTEANPCLWSCPRQSATLGLSPNLGPDIVILDELEDLYVAVRFDHRTHATMSGMSGGCEACHHYTPPDRPHPECKSCHAVGVVNGNIDQPGLKGAYHRQCMNCHSDWDHETKCEVCHEKRAGGRLEGTATEVCEHSHYEAVELMDLMIFSTGYQEGDKVPFHHKNHSSMYERDCTECHREQSCTRCHVHGQELHPMGEPADTDLHDTCFACHNSERCADCHGRDPEDLFKHSETGWPLRAYHQDLNCRACHGAVGQFQKLTPVCENCHHGGWSGDAFDHAMTGVALDETHGELECGDCHAQGVGKKASCEACHDDGRVYQRAVGFGGS